MTVASENRDFVEALHKWRIIDDVYAGQRAVKLRGEHYLPRPNPEDTSQDNIARYESYIQRAVFYNVVRRTLKGLVGLCFKRDPDIMTPDELLPIVDNADGSGITLIQLAKFATRQVIGKGRAGIFADYPALDGPITVAQKEAGTIRPTIRCFSPEKVINWRTSVRGGQTVLSLVVIAERYVISDDGFRRVWGRQWRVLRLEGMVGIGAPSTDPVDYSPNVGEYVVDIYRDRQIPTAQSNPYQSYRPTDAQGNRLPFIPFIFIGCEDNSPEVDDAPLYDMAELNIAHYRNSADYEESTFIIGQPTPVVAGITKTWNDTVLRGKIFLGSRAAVPLPVGGTATLLQAAPNSMAFEAMNHKEKQMVAIGANLIDASKSARTATETLIDDTNESSVLDTCGDNVSDAFTQALKWCALFMGVEILDSPPTCFIVNTDHNLINLTPQQRQELVLEWQASAITFGEMRDNFRRAGIVTLEDNEAKKEISEYPPPPPSTAPKPIPPGNNNNDGGNPATNASGDSSGT